jgi:hypothetical protein
MTGAVLSNPGLHHHHHDHDHDHHHGDDHRHA